MKKAFSAAVCAAAMIGAAGVASDADAQQFTIIKGTPFFGQTLPIIALQEQTSLGTWVAATIAESSNRTGTLFPATLPSRANRNAGLGAQLIASGFFPTSPSRWPFVPQ